MKKEKVVHHMPVTTDDSHLSVLVIACRKA